MSTKMTDMRVGWWVEWQSCFRGAGDSEGSLWEARWEEVSMDPVLEVLTFTRFEIQV